MCARHDPCGRMGMRARVCQMLGLGNQAGVQAGWAAGGGGALRGGAAAVSPQSFRTRKVGSNLGEELPRTRQGWSRSQDAEQEVQWVEFVGERAHLFFFLFLNN